MADDFKYHIDHHVGLVPPPKLLEARVAHLRGGLDETEFRAAQDAAITDALRMQKRVAVTAVGDGQYRRRHGLSVVYDNVEGFADEPGAGNAVAELLGPRLAPERRSLLATPVLRDRLARQEAAFLTAATGHPLMLALPAPGYVLALCGEEGSAGEELASIVRDEVSALAAEGIAYIQLHNPLLGFLLTVAGAGRALALGIDTASLLERVLDADAAVLAGLDVPADFRVGLDITTSGALDMRQGYDTETVAAFLGCQPFGRLCVEYPAAEPGRFPIEMLRPGCVVALGIVDVSVPETESVDELLERMDKVAAVMDIDDVAISTNGGFAAAAKPLTETPQREKLQLVETVARYFWGNEL